MIRAPLVVTSLALALMFTGVYAAQGADGDPTAVPDAVVQESASPSPTAQAPTPEPSITPSATTSPEPTVSATAPVPAVQYVTWAPTNSNGSADGGTLIPDVAATTDGDGAISYAVTSPGMTGCTVDSVTGAITFTDPGTCEVTATAAQTDSFAQGSVAVKFALTEGADQVRWAPSNTTALAPEGVLVPDQPATAPGGGSVMYRVVDAGSTDCVVNPKNGTIKFAGAGVCQVAAEATDTRAAPRVVTFTIRRATQAVTWEPSNTSIDGPSGTHIAFGVRVPNVAPATDGAGPLSFSVIDPGDSGCTVDQWTGIINYDRRGGCVVTVTAAQSASYLANSVTVTFSL